jgi:hypothetical protein
MKPHYQSSLTQPKLWLRSPLHTADFGGAVAFVINGTAVRALDFADRWPLLASAGFSSLIVANFPALFAEFDAKRFTLLSRSSCNGFGAGDCHGRSDGHAPTLTLIQDTKGSRSSGMGCID